MRFSMLLILSVFLPASFATANIEQSDKSEKICDTQLLPQGTLVSLTLEELLDDSYLEESLSLEEYPELLVENENGQISVWLGASLYENGRDDTAVKNLVFSETEQKYLISMYDEPLFQLEVDRIQDTAELYAYEAGEWVLIAKFH